MIGTDGMLRPMPLSPVLKSGSWPVLQPFYPEIDTLPIHHRFDGQPICYLPPRNPAATRVDTGKTHLVFPQYGPQVSTTLTPLTLIEALALVADAGYEVADSHDVRTIEQWITLLRSCSLHRLVYSDLEEAHRVIESVIDETY